MFVFVVVVWLGVTRSTWGDFVYFMLWGALGVRGSPGGRPKGGGGTTCDRQPVRKRGVSPELGGSPLSQFRWPPPPGLGGLPGVGDKLEGPPSFLHRVIENVYLTCLMTG